MAKLRLQRNAAPSGAFYAALLDAHDDLDDEASWLLNAKLILLLSNHIGDVDVLNEALRRARADIDAQDPGDPP